MSATQSRPQARRHDAALVACGALLLTGAVASAVLWVNLPPRHQHPYGLHLASNHLFRSLWPYPVLEIGAPEFRRLARILVGIQWMAYFIAMAAVAVQSPDRSRRNDLIAIGIAAVIALVTALIFPTILSADVFHYALQGRLFSLHDLNPYVTTSVIVPNDPFRSLAVWNDVTSQYGPAWNLLAAALTAITRDDVVCTVVGFKVVGAASHVISTLCIASLARITVGVRSDLAAILFGWNPLILVESAGSGHNDAFMLALALAGVVCLSVERSRTAVVLLAGSICVKYITAILAALALIRSLGALKATNRPRTAMAWGAVGAATVVGLYLPFVSGTISPLDFFTGLSSDLNQMPNFIGLAVVDAAESTLRHSGLDATASGRTIVNLIFAAACTIALAHAARPGSTLTSVFLPYGILSFCYAFVVFGGSFPWYLVSPIAGAALSGASRSALFFTALVVTIALQLMLGYVSIGQMPAQVAG